MLSYYNLSAALSISHDTLLRIYQTNVTPRAISTVIGLDEFTWRKGHTYGTIIYDFVISKIIAVLQDRQLETVCQSKQFEKQVTYNSTMKILCV